MKQVAHIRQISLALRKRFGERRRIGSQLVFTFASPRRLAQASEKIYSIANFAIARKICVRRAARQLRQGDLEGWSALSDAELRKQLSALPGVGRRLQIA